MPMAVSGSDEKIHFLDLTIKQELGIIDTGQDATLGLEFNPNGRFLNVWTESGVVQIWAMK